ncbi:hypothetical protein BDF22DRAFT_663169 [Syncephalis plumigaleata]|nr:hypothetical protein BDF22DRAFT_663169 [Syncephalis plumigaleata]
MKALTDEERTTKWVSTIDVILMLLWRVSVRIRDLPKDKLIGVFSPLNMRFFWRDFPNNYFGNVFHATSLILPAGRVIEGSLGDLAISYRQSVNASKQDSKECVLGLSDNDTSTSLVNKDANWLSYIDFSSTDWTKLGYYDMDFGYGAPIRYRRYMYPIMPSATIYDTPVDPVTLKRNIEVCIPVDKRHYDRFINDEELTTYARLIG